MDIDQMMIDIRQLKERVSALEDYSGINTHFTAPPEADASAEADPNALPAPPDPDANQPGPAVEDQQTA